jgi:hypothetical protein
MLTTIPVNVTLFAMAVQQTMTQLLVTHVLTRLIIPLRLVVVSLIVPPMSTIVHQLHAPHVILQMLVVSLVVPLSATYVPHQKYQIPVSEIVDATQRHTTIQVEELVLPSLPIVLLTMLV